MNLKETKKLEINRVLFSSSCLCIFEIIPGLILKIISLCEIIPLSWYISVVFSKFLKCTIGSNLFYLSLLIPNDFYYFSTSEGM